MNVEMDHCVGHRTVLFMHFELGTIGTRIRMLLQILFHADPTIVLLQFGNLLRHQEVRISLSELADDRSSESDGQVQGSFWRSFGALRFALHPHHVVFVNHQVFVERFKA